MRIQLTGLAQAGLLPATCAPGWELALDGPRRAGADDASGGFLTSNGDHAAARVLLQLVRWQADKRRFLQLRPNPSRLDKPDKVSPCSAGTLAQTRCPGRFCIAALIQSCAAYLEASASALHFPRASYRDSQVSDTEGPTGGQQGAAPRGKAESQWHPPVSLQCTLA